MSVEQFERAIKKVRTNGEAGPWPALRLAGGDEIVDEQIQFHLRWLEDTGA